MRAGNSASACAYGEGNCTEVRMRGDSYEKNIPAKQNKKVQKAWIPHANEHH